MGIFVWFQDSLSLSCAFTFNRQRAPAVSALSGFLRPDVEKPPTDLPLHPGANSFMFEDFENFEENEEKQKKPPGSTQLYSIWYFHAFSQLSLEMELLDFHIKES